MRFLIWIAILFPGASRFMLRAAGLFVLSFVIYMWMHAPH